MLAWALALGLAAFCAPAWASPMLIGATSDGMIYDVDPATGAATNPRDTGIDSLTGIAFASAEALYAIDSGNTLHIVDVGIGNSVEVANLNISSHAVDVAVHDTSGSLFALAWPVGCTGVDLYSIDPETGAASLQAYLSGAPGGGGKPTLDFDGLGQLFVVDIFAQELQTLDVETGAVLHGVGLSESVGPRCSIVFGNSGQLFLFDPDASNSGLLYSVDVLSGALIGIGPTGIEGNLTSVAFVPEPGSLLLLVVGTMVLRPRWRSGGKCAELPRGGAKRCTAV